jgi:hypothetical protein
MSLRVVACICLVTRLPLGAMASHTVEASSSNGPTLASYRRSPWSCWVGLALCRVLVTVSAASAFSYRDCRSCSGSHSAA